MHFKYIVVVMRGVQIQMAEDMACEPDQDSRLEGMLTGKVDAAMLSYLNMTWMEKVFPSGS